MLGWHERIGNDIEMLFEGEWVKGKVVEGERYREGIITMDTGKKIIYCGVCSGCYRKTETSLGDFISNFDRIHAMNEEEIAKLLLQIEQDKEEGWAWGSFETVMKFLQSEAKSEKQHE